MKVLKELVCFFFPLYRNRFLVWLTCGPMENQLSNDPSLSSLPLLTTFLRSYSRPYLGITPPQFLKAAANEDVNEHGTEHGAKDNESPITETEELVEKDIRDRFKRMCEGYFQNVSKKLVVEHNVRGIRLRLTHVTEH